MKSAINHFEQPGRSIARQVQQDPADYQYEVKAHDEGSLKWCVKYGRLEAE